MKKKSYETAEAEVIMLTYMDIVTASGVIEEDDVCHYEGPQIPIED